MYVVEKFTECTANHWENRLEQRVISLCYYSLKLVCTISSLWSGEQVFMACSTPTHFVLLSIMWSLQFSLPYLPVVQLLDYFSYRGQLHLAYERLSCNLHHILLKNSEEGLPLYIVKECSRHILRALGFLATSRVVHGDVKMSNIMWHANRGIFQLVDFGLSFLQGNQVRLMCAFKKLGFSYNLFGHVSVENFLQVQISCYKLSNNKCYTFFFKWRSCHRLNRMQGCW